MLPGAAAVPPTRATKRWGAVLATGVQCAASCACSCPSRPKSSRARASPLGAPATPSGNDAKGQATGPNPTPAVPAAGTAAAAANHGAADCDTRSHCSNCVASGAASADHSGVAPLAAAPKVFNSSKKRPAASLIAASGLNPAPGVGVAMLCALRKY